MPHSDEKKVVGIHTNENLPTLFADTLTVNTRSDGFSLIRFTANLPEGLTEQARIMIPPESLKKMLDVLCSHSNYYPVKSKPRKKRN